MKKLPLALLVTTCCFHFANAQKDSVHLKVTKLADGFYIHTTYHMINNYPFPCNGLIVESTGGVVLVDNGWGDEQTDELIDWVRTHIKKKIVLSIGTHFHEDRIGGVAKLNKLNIPTISYSLTEKLAKEHNVPAPKGILPVDTTLKIGNIKMECFYPGEGHTKDNIVVWFPAQKILFGGCLVKSMEAKDLGNLADANVTAYPTTIQRVMKKFPNAKYVIPGHQSWDPGSLQHTLELANKAKNKSSAP